jgi:hypothetical protein
MRIVGPVTGVGPQCERLLRALPGWFGIEQSIVDYVAAIQTMPTFLAHDRGSIRSDS